MSISMRQERIIGSLIGGWLARGWRDFMQAPLLNMLYATLFLVIGLGAVSGLLLDGFSLVYFILAGGFLIVAPGLVTVYYFLAARIHSGHRPVFSDLGRGLRESPVSVIVIGLVSLVLYLIWITDALIIYSVYFDFVPMALFSTLDDPVLKQDVRAFLLFAGILGFVLSFIIFCVTVFSVPYALEERCGLVDAVSFSVQAVSRNRRVMLSWALVLAGMTFGTVLLALPLLVLVLPLLAYANHAAYKDMRQVMESAG
ncbi:MAG: DUF2189 domain-containing protein [Sedimenticola sp.]|nr:DUF2189 domain-containing protein [Sedimenticola sp.]